MSMENLQSVVVAVSAALTKAKVPHALTGGLAVAAWAPRHEVFTTDDVDFGILAGKRDPSRIILKQVAGATPADQPYTDLERVSFIKVNVGEIRVDFVLPRNSAFVREAFRRAGQIKVAGAVIPLLSPEDVFLYKSIAARPKDIKALAALTYASRFNWNYVNRWAKKLGTDGALRALRII